jgi:hypothetical protein
MYVVWIASLEANRNTRTRTCGSDERLMLPPDRGGVPVVQSAPPLHCDIILGYCGASNPLADICQNQLPGCDTWQSLNKELNEIFSSIPVYILP